MPESQLVEQKEVIRDFKSKFYADYGVNLHVFVPPKEDNRITLTTLEIVTLATLYRDIPKFTHITSLLNRTRVKEYMIYLHNFCYIAHSLGYNKSKIGIYLERNHATVINSCKRVSNGMDINDKFTIDVYNNIINELKNYVGTIPENLESKNDPKPVTDTIWDQARRLLAIYN